MKNLLGSLSITFNEPCMMTVRNTGYLVLTRILQEASDDTVTRLTFSVVSLYYCHYNLLYERFHLSERLCALEVEQPDRLLASTEKRRSETSCLVAKAILKCVSGQSTLVSRLMPPKSQAHLFFDIGNSSYFLDVHLIGALLCIARTSQSDRERNITILWN